MHEEGDLDVDARLDALLETQDKHDDARCFRSQLAVCQEVRRLARLEQRLIPYLQGSFNVLRACCSLMLPRTRTDVALEMIALLEDESAARRFQPNIDSDDYQNIIYHYTSCAYDNLADGTGELKGYNSEGMHACINDGVGVCRRTGKTQCITCFREYATEVYLAADDLDMALHFARHGEAHSDKGQHDRRWVSARAQARIHLFTGDLQQSHDDLLRAWSLIPSYHAPAVARARTRQALRGVLLLQGSSRTVDELIGPIDESEPCPPPGEDPQTEYETQMTDALAAALDGQYDHACAILAAWETRLDQQGDHGSWSAARLQHVATLGLAGRQEPMQRLAAQLERRARRSRDWLLLRRLAPLVDPHGSIRLNAPVPGGSSSQPASAPKPSAPAVPETPPPNPGLLDEFDAKIETAHEQNDTSALHAVLGQLLEISAEPTTSAAERAGLLSLALRLAQVTEIDRERLWGWVQQVSQGHENDPTVLNLHAVLAHIIGSVEQGAERLPGLPSDDELDVRVRRSLDLDPSNPGNHARAGTYYSLRNRPDEAERCLARGFRLDRSNGRLAGRLAAAYRADDRPRDALAVLDLALREGCELPAVPWEAALLAFNLGENESVLLYLDRLAELTPGTVDPWANYYRARALVNLAQYARAREAAEREQRSNPAAAHATQLVLAIAAAREQSIDELQNQLEQILSVRLADEQGLSFSGMCSLYSELWSTVAPVLAGNPLRADLARVLLTTGLAPPDLFEEARKTADVVSRLNYYTVTIEQNLEPQWADDPACLAGEQEAVAYVLDWGVLARDEEEARDVALDWQGRCYPLAAQVLGVSHDGSDYEDRPGVVWQGARRIRLAGDAADEE